MMMTVGRVSVRILRSRLLATSRSVHSTASARARVCIGDVCAETLPVRDAFRVPSGFLAKLPHDARTLSHLRWCLLKDGTTASDMMLIGIGPQRRRLALAYAELRQREVEMLTLTRDTTEADIKQRRELIGGNVVFVDAAPVRAAVNGRLLLLEGVERAERNILPSLNNLLENREMALEDGRFLVSPDRWSALLRDGAASDDARAQLEERLRAQGLVPVSPHFRVLAIGMPCPPLPGRPIDPPLRSRFSARRIDAALPADAGRAHPALASLAAFVSAVHELLHPTGGQAALPPSAQAAAFPSSTWPALARHMDTFPLDAAASLQLLHRAYPFSLLPALRRTAASTSASPTYPSLSKPSSTSLLHPSFHQLLRASALSGSSPLSSYYVERINVVNEQRALVTFGSLPKGASPPVQLECAVGRSSPRMSGGALPATLSRFLDGLLQSHTLGQHVCIVGPSGCGKSTVAAAFVDSLGYEGFVFPLHADMTARDLLQRRVTDASGNSAWQDSPLLQAALNGDVCVLDGIDRLTPDTLASLSSILLDGYAQLPDGSVLRAEWQDGRARCIHPSFRVLALCAVVDIAGWKAGAALSWSGTGSPQVDGRAAKHVLTHPDVLPLFHYHLMPVLDDSDLLHIIRHHAAGVSEKSATQLLGIARDLQVEPDGSIDAPTCDMLRLNLHHLVRFARLLVHHSDGFAQVGREIQDATFYPILPAAAKAIVAGALQRHGFASPASAVSGSPLRVEQSVLPDGAGIEVRIGSVIRRNALPRAPELVPRTRFYDVPKHVEHLQDLLVDLNSGERALLLVGDQGTGKNKLVDRLLQLLQKEREYVQLHRDTTVASLTVQPVVRDGVLTWEDSPLVRAVKHGYALVIDELDKAPAEVVVVLKSLVQDGYMLLSDGRRIVRTTNGAAEREADDAIIHIHPDFVVFCLANRPGYPFLGNNVFARGFASCFAAHWIDNVDPVSELQLLQSYAPSVDERILQALVDAFAGLRKAYRASTIAYPYSTREIVAVAKHLDACPSDGVGRALQNVLAFDAFDPVTLKTVTDVLVQHGLAVPMPWDEEAAVVPRIQRASVEPTASSKSPSAVPPRRHFSTTSRTVLRPRWTTVRARKWTPDVDLAPPPVRMFPAATPRDAVFAEVKGAWRLLAPSKSDDCTVIAAAAVAAPDASEHIAAVSVNPLALHVCSSVSAPVAALSDTMGPAVSRSYSQLRLGLAQQLPIALGGLLPPEMTNNRQAARLLTLPKLAATPVQPALPPALCAIPGIGFLLLLPAVAVLGMVPAVSPSRTSLLDVSACPLLRSGAPISVTATHSSDGAVLWSSSSACVYVINRLMAAPQAVDIDLSSFLSPGDVVANVTASSPGEFEVTARTSGTLRVCVDGPSVLVEPVNSSSSTVSTGANDVSGQLVVRAPDGLEIAWNHGAGALTWRRGAQRWTLPLHHPGAAHICETHTVKGPHTFLVHADGLVHMLQLRGNRLDDDEALWKSVQGDADADAWRVLVETEHAGEAAVWRKKIAGSQQPHAGVISLQEALQLSERKKPQGGAEGHPGQQDASRPPPKVEQPKHGREDPKNEPHVGGATWAGGTGGSNTAGLGGRGGPYRLDKGHRVHQVRDKLAVPESVAQQARRMAEEALAAKLKSIGMKPEDAERYADVRARVEPDITMLRHVLLSADMHSDERSWKRHQSTGDLDDTKLVDGLAGDKHIFKRRADPDDPFAPHTAQPALLHFVFDASASMYRFNSLDGRLDRSLEVAVLVMEAFAGMERRFVYRFSLHSGDAPDVPLADPMAPRANELERLRIVESIVAHSQYCSSGDHTLEGAAAALRASSAPIPGISERGRFVFVLSDANFRRYGVSPNDVVRAFSQHAAVHSHLFLIGGMESDDDEAFEIARAMPSHLCHVVRQTRDLPALFKRILTQALSSRF